MKLYSDWPLLSASAVVRFHEIFRLAYTSRLLKFSHLHLQAVLLLLRESSKKFDSGKHRSGQSLHVASKGKVSRREGWMGDF